VITNRTVNAPDSTTTRASPRATLSPGDFNQLTIFPSVIVDDNAGMKTSFTAQRGAQTLLLDGEEDVRRPAPILRDKLDVSIFIVYRYEYIKIG
jgi:hypothetical protein